MQRKNILVVEDDGDILDAIGLILKDEGFGVFKTNNDYFVEKLIKEEVKVPDLILLDLRLGENDGREICKRLKSDKIAKNIPIIMISAYPNVRKSSLAAGADDFLAKPFEIDDLLKKVHHFLRKT